MFFQELSTLHTYYFIKQERRGRTKEERRRGKRKEAFRRGGLSTTRTTTT